MGWIVAALIYAMGCIEVYMVRRDVSADWRARAAGVLLWPIAVPFAWLSGDGLYRRDNR